MLPADKGNCDLRTLLQADPIKFVGAEPNGSPAPESQDPIPTAASTAIPASDSFAPAGEEDDSGYTMMRITAPAVAPATSQTPGPLIGKADILEGETPSWMLQPVVPKPIVAHRGGTGGRDHDDNGRYGQTKQEDADGPHRQANQEDDAGRGSTDRDPGNDGGAFDEVDWGHSISVMQTADVDQNASIIMHGYVGTVVARLHGDQEIMMDQKVEIDITNYGDGHWSLLLDQDTLIDQETEIDLKIFDLDGILYVDLLMHNSIEVDQDTTIEIGDGPRGGALQITQDIELDQDVDIDIDIEDDLEDRYHVKVDVNVLQEADADHEAYVDITDRNGEVDMDVDAVQTAAVDQETVVQIDFALA